MKLFNNLLNFEDIKEVGEYVAITESGKRYIAEAVKNDIKPFCNSNGIIVYFTIPATETVKGYIRLCNVNIKLVFSSGRVYTDKVPYDSWKEAETEKEMFLSMKEDDKDFCKNGEKIISKEWEEIR